jgi:hypothetical protein
MELAKAATKMAEATTRVIKRAHAIEEAVAEALAIAMEVELEGLDVASDRDEARAHEEALKTLRTLTRTIDWIMGEADPSWPRERLQAGVALRLSARGLRWEP